jgi:hypothetical protein
MFSFRGVLTTSFHIEIDRGKMIGSEALGVTCVPEHHPARGTKEHEGFE